MPTTPKEMITNSQVALTFFLGISLCGFYFFDLLQKHKKGEERLRELELKLEQLESQQETDSETLNEMDSRIREKKDYDEEDEVEVNKYQTWKGEWKDQDKSLTIQIWKEKFSTMKKNHAWICWNGESDNATIVRDFYLGNSSPEFSWTITESEDCFQGTVFDTMVNGWDSTVKIQMTFVSKSKQSLLDFVGEKYYNGSPTLNQLLQKLVQGTKISWTRTILDLN